MAGSGENRHRAFAGPAFAVHAVQGGLACLPNLAVVNRRENAVDAEHTAIADPASFAAALLELSGRGDVFLKPAIGKRGHGVYRVSAGGRAVGRGVMAGFMSAY